MSRSQIDRLTRRIEGLPAKRKPPEQRIFTVRMRSLRGSAPSMVSRTAFRSRRARAKPQKMNTGHGTQEHFLGNRSSSNTEAGTTAKAEPQESPKSTAQSPSEE